MLGGVGLPGGGFAFGHGSANGVGMPRINVPAPEIPLPANPAKSAIPVARIADMLLDPGGTYEFNGRRETYPDVRLVYWAGGNPFHHHQDLNRLQRAWQKPETVVVHESWWNPTARHADIVLPATTPLERNDIGGSSRDPFVFAMHRAIDPVHDARNDFDIFRALARRLGYEQTFTEGRDELGWCQWVYDTMRAQAERQGVPLPGFQQFWAEGFVELPPPERDFVLFEDFRRDPGQASAQHAVAPHRDLVRRHRALRLRRLPAAPDLVRAGRMAGRHDDRALADPPGDASAAAPSCTARWIPARSRAPPRSPGREPVRLHPADAARARHHSRRPGARVQRSRRMPGDRQWWTTT